MDQSDVLYIMKLVNENSELSKRVAALEVEVKNLTGIQQRFNAIADALQCLHDGDSLSNEKWFMGKICEVRQQH